MSAHVSVFDLKRFAEERLAADELPSFERHLSACASCAERLQRAATRELQARGLDGLIAESPRRSGAVLIALAASVLFALSLGEQGAQRAIDPSRSSSPVSTSSADAGDGSIAFFDGGPRR